MHKPDIIVIGGDHHNTLGVIRSLGEKGLHPITLIVTSGKHPFVGYSKYIKSLHIISCENGIVQYLLNNFKNKDDRSVVICCSDAAASEVDLHAIELKTHFIIPGSDEQGAITRLMNKKWMSELALQCGMNIPRTIYPTHLPIDIKDITFPCIVKPLVSKDASKDDIQICRDIYRLNEWVEHLGADKVQIQEFIDKEFEYQLIGCATYENVIIPGFSRILRPCKGSNTSFLHYEPMKKGFCDLEACKNYVKMTGYHGLFSLEFLRDKQGRDYFMEINFRNDGNAICVTASGINLPYIWYKTCTGQNCYDEIQRTVSPKYVMPDFAELKLLMTGQISLIQYLGDLIKTDRFMEFDRKDPKPFWRLLLSKFGQN